MDWFTKVCQVDDETRGVYHEEHVSRENINPDKIRRSLSKSQTLWQSSSLSLYRGLRLPYSTSNVDDTQINQLKQEGLSTQEYFRKLQEVSLATQQQRTEKDIDDFVRYLTHLSFRPVIDSWTLSKELAQNIAVHGAWNTIEDSYLLRTVPVVCQVNVPSSVVIHPQVLKSDFGKSLATEEQECWITIPLGWEDVVNKHEFLDLLEKIRKAGGFLQYRS